MSTTTNLGLTKPANGSDVDTWDVPVNANSDILDAVAGSVTTINAVAAFGTVVLTSTQYRPRILIISGALTANVNYQLPTGIGGTWSVGNATSNAFTITISSGGGGTTVIVPQGGRSLVCSDGANVFLADSSGPIPVGLIGIWSSALGSIPSNWHLCDGTNGTIDLRDKFIVGAGGAYAVGATGGATSNTPTITVAGTALSVANLPSYNLTVTDPGHSHPITDPEHLHGIISGEANISGTFGYTPGSSLASTVDTVGNQILNASTGITVDNAATGISVASGGGGAAHGHPGSTSTPVPTLPPYYALAFIQKIA